MAPRKKTAGVSIPATADEETSAPLDLDSSPSMTRREAAKQRHVSLKQCAILLNRDRNTVMKYLDQGMPSVEKADRERGVAWVLDLGEVVRWLEERAADNVTQRLNGGKEGQINEDEAKRRRAVAQAFTAELEYAESARIVARIHDMLDLVREDYSEISSRLKGVPDAIASRVDSKIAEKVRKIAYELINETLFTLAAPKQIEKIAKGK